MTKDFNQNLEHIGLAGPVFLADKDIDKAVAVEIQREVFKIYILTDASRF